MVKQKDELIEQTQLTAFESQLARSLRKPEDQVKAACLRYLALYAGVKSSDVCAQLWLAARKAVQE